MAEYRFTFDGRRVRSLNWWKSGKTKQAKMWRFQVAKNERTVMSRIFKYQNDFKITKNSKLTIKLIRVYSTQFERLYDDDNYIGGCKHLRDGIAEGLGFASDNNSRLTWDYDQQKTKEMLNRLEVIVEVNNG
jgi:hypothetical protein